MKVRAIREDDPVYGAGDNNFVFDKEAVATLLNTRLKTFKGEIQRNIDFGIPDVSDWKGLDQDDLDIEISDIILNTANVVEITSFISTLVNNEYSASIIVKTEFGELEVVI